jgi:F-type H+-transporting ATPase subunit gamma
MSLQLQKAKGRLENIRKVQPILAALRTISLGSWQMARNRRVGLTAYTARLLDLLTVVVPHVVEERSQTKLSRIYRWARRRVHRAEPEPVARNNAVVLLVVGSERGLCGGYNKAILEVLRSYVDGLESGWDLTLMASGSRMIRDLRSAGYEPGWTREASITALPSFELAYGLVSDWLQRYEAGELDAVDLLYNADQGVGRYAATVTRLIPPELPEPSEPHLESGLVAPQDLFLRDRVIVETDPVGLYVRIVEQWTAIALYRVLLDAAATEHSARYQLMESATQNAEDLVEELMLAVQSARRQAITRQVQELAVGAGMLTSGKSD